MLVVEVGRQKGSPINHSYSGTSLNLFMGVCLLTVTDTSFNITCYSLRMLLHKSSSPQSSSTVQKLQSSDYENSRSAWSSVRKVLDESLSRLQEEPAKHTKSIRWELGACWVQHLQNQASGKTESKKTEEAKAEPAVKGLGKQGGLLKEIKKKMDVKSGKSEQGKEVLAGNNLDDNKISDASNQKELEKQDAEKETAWRKLLPEAAYLRLKESDTGLHLKVCCRLYLNDFLQAYFGISDGLYKVL